MKGHSFKNTAEFLIIVFHRVVPPASNQIPCLLTWGLPKKRPAHLKMYLQKHECMESNFSDSIKLFFSLLRVKRLPREYLQHPPVNRLSRIPEGT